MGIFEQNPYSNIHNMNLDWMIRQIQDDAEDCAEALTTAQNAVTTANTASTTAQNAQTAAASAVTTANTASSTASSASQQVTALSQEVDAKLDAPASAGTEGQVLSLDSDLDPVWITPSDTDTTYAISIASNVITLTGSDGSTSTVTLPVYNGGIS